MKHLILSAAVVAVASSAQASIDDLAECYYEKARKDCILYCDVDFATLPSKYIVSTYATHGLGQMTIRKVEFSRKTNKATVIVDSFGDSARDVKDCL